MRFIASVLLGGLFSSIALAGCGSPEATSSNSGASGSGGTPIDGKQVCLEWCVKSDQLCSLPGDRCVEWCDTWFRNGGAECYDVLTAELECLLSTTQSNECIQGYPPECEHPQAAERSYCVYQFGFTANLKCYSDTGPSGEAACNCGGYRANVPYDSKCWSTGGMSVCECLVDQMLVGTCAGGPEPFCDVEVYRGCCNEYFMLPF
jgi:hypothetical protein